jgi:hypothetical protein
MLHGSRNPPERTTQLLIQSLAMRGGYPASSIRERSVGHRPTMAAALRMLLRGVRVRSPLMLYRGTNNHERRRRLYGFSWTTDIATARTFAAHWSQPISANLGEGFQGVVLQTCAPPDAILLIRRPEEYYDEGEVVVDPVSPRQGRCHRAKPLTFIAAASSLPLGKQIGEIASLKISRHPDLRFRHRGGCKRALVRNAPRDELVSRHPREVRASDSV